MSPRSAYNDQRSERPTLPPIRDLIRELDTPHNSPSLTLAHLRLSDEDHKSHLPGPSFHSQHATLNHPQHYPIVRSAHRHYTTRADHNAVSPRGHGVESDVRYSENGRRESRTELYTHTYTSQTWTSQYHHPYSTPKYFSGFGVSQDPRAGVQNHSSGNQLGDLYTSIPPLHSIEGEQTPVAHQHNSEPRNTIHSQLASEDNPSVGPMKYECNYCGKGFNRPSSLKIHLNSHTGEKPFVCPVESCGRSFSVLSNMRRHARVHTQSTMKSLGTTSDDESEQTSSSGIRHTSSSAGAPSNRVVSADTWNRRRRGSISTSSTNSQRSQSISSQDEFEDRNSYSNERIRRCPN